MLHSIFWDGHPMMQGSVYTLPDQTAQSIIRAGKAVEVKDDSTIEREMIALDTTTEFSVESTNEPHKKRGRRSR